MSKSSCSVLNQAIVASGLWSLIQRLSMSLHYDNPCRLRRRAAIKPITTLTRDNGSNDGARTYH